jgi:hypothetical protein
MDPSEMKEPQGSFAASEETLHDEACKLAGCDDFGDPSYTAEARRTR